MPHPFTLGAVPVAVSLVGNLVTDTIKIDAPWWDPATWAAFAVLVALTVRIESNRARAARESTVDSAVILGQAAEDLAQAVASQWRAEMNARGLGHPDPIRIRWSATSRPVTPSPVELLDAHQRPVPPVKVTRLRLSGDLADTTRTLAKCRGFTFMAATGSWLRFAAARLWLAARRQLPCSLMSFLQEAYDLGVLRQVGAVYQFRHARLQEHLATLHRTDPRRSNPATETPEHHTSVA